MKNLFRCAAIVAVASLTLASFANAQTNWEVNGPNAVYTINTQVPSAANPTTHDVLVSVPGAFFQEIVTNANQQAGVILTFSFVNPLGNATINVPGLGVYNLGVAALPIPTAIAIAGDGISFTQGPLDQFYRSDNGNATLGTPPTFLLAYNVGTVFCNTRIAWQAVVADPTAGAFGLDFTEAGDANFVGGQALILLTGDDGSVNIPFAAGNTFNFHGINYSDVFVCGNGFVSFGGFTTINAAGFTVDSVSAINAQPAIFACMTDWNVSGFAFTDGIFYDETGAVATFNWGDPRGMPSGNGGVPHFADNDLNRFSIALQLSSDGSNPCVPINANEGEFRLFYDFFDSTTNNRPGDGLMGHTPGFAALVGGAADVDLHGTNLPSGGFAQVEEHNNTGFNGSVIGWDGAGSARAYNEFRNWGGQGVTFIPTGAPTGSLGYLTLGSCSTVDDVEGLSAPSIPNSGATITATGKFCGFGPTGSVVLDAGGAVGGPFLAGVVGVLDGQYGLPGALPNIPSAGAFRDAEGLVLITPSLGTYTGPIQMDINFDSGFIASFTVNVTGPGSTFTNYPNLPDDGGVLHTLNPLNPITHYGTSYTQFFVNSNGSVTFQLSTFGFVPSTTELFAGLDSPGNQSVCPMYADLNRFGSGSNVTVLENSFTGQVTVSYVNQQWWNSIAPAGTVSVTFDPVSANLQFDHSGFIAAPPGIDDVLVGLSNADGIGTNDIVGLSLGYVSTSPNESIGQLDLSGSTPNYVTFNGTGMWNITDTGGGMFVIF